jgi:DNA topoisomerase-1
MEESLVIVESPAKAKTISKYLGSGFKVIASVGHVLDLPPKTMGVDLDSGSFKPQYEPILGKSKVIAEIKKNAKKADHVYLAPDPDREGEAIAYHLASIVKEACGNHPPSIHRVRFHELTKKAIAASFKAPDHLNQSLFDSQQARRILDRVVGYLISPVLWKKVQRGLSAGRVQSVAVRLVVDREREIESFQKREYWTIEALAEGDFDPFFKVKLAKIGNKKAEISNQQQAVAIKDALMAEGASAVVESVQNKERIRRPGPPFITSKLQQDAARAFRFSSKQTMRIAQSLYEGIELGDEGSVGLITYMRTDSTKVSPDAIKEVQEFILDNYGKNYLPNTPNIFKNKKNAQEAHEAIRPTSLANTKEKLKNYLTADQLKLYSLIFDRFVASQMMPALYEQTTVEVTKDEYVLKATGSRLRFGGFLQAYKEVADEDDKTALDDVASEQVNLPLLHKGDPVVLKNVSADQHFTEPPPRFSESSLVKELEEKGIGRPSTYAAIMSTIVDKGYTEKQQGRFYPTELGRVVTDLLLENFPDIMNVEFTASMEEKLDAIEDGTADWVKTLNTFYSPFKISVEKAKENMRDVKRMEEKTDITCKRCSAPMVVKWGKAGSFLGCSAYPNCNYTTPFKREGGIIVPIEAKETVSVKCSSCGASMVIKRGKFGEFLGCSRYPDCSSTQPLPTGVVCPKPNCGGNVLVKKTKRGKAFYGCSNYPSCDFVSWQKPVPKPCEHCESPYLLEKISRDKISLICPQCKAVFSV